MYAIKRAFWGALLVLTGIWLLTGDVWPVPFNYFLFRSYVMQYTGLIAFAVMSIDMILATRPKWLETRLNGLDKTYRLHKWFGITALLMSSVHWLFGQGTKWTVGWGWLQRPIRKNSGSGIEAAGLEEWLRSWRHLAETMGEWAFYAAVVLIIIALVKFIPYHWFLKLHKIFAILYLAFVFHTLILIKFSYWQQPFGWAVAVMALAGTVSSVIVLLGLTGRSRQVKGEVTALTFETAHGVLQAKCRVPNSWPGHEAGQFAYIRTAADNDDHPFTIASAWDENDKTLSFSIKALGDYTSRLHDTLKVGDEICIEGPYGRFTFDDDRNLQIWIGAGIGVTPFLARLQAIVNAQGVEKREVVFFYTTADCTENAEIHMQQLAEAAGVRLHFMLDRRDGLLNGQRLREFVPNWKNASIWFCGPVGFARQIEKDLIINGLQPAAFYREFFEMR